MAAIWVRAPERPGPYFNTQKTTLWQGVTPRTIATVPLRQVPTPPPGGFFLRPPLFFHGQGSQGAQVNSTLGGDTGSLA